MPSLTFTYGVPGRQEQCGFWDLIDWMQGFWSRVDVAEKPQRYGIN